MATCITSLQNLITSKQANPAIHNAEILFNTESNLLFILLPMLPNVNTIKECVNTAARMPPKIAEIEDEFVSIICEKIAP